ncbi:MAG: hypothetical protein ABSH24_03325 [Bryobacteraceae bacterium]|jgi:hypothetical protein
MERFDQAVTVLTLTMGLCLMWEGYTDLSETGKMAGLPARDKGATQLSGLDIGSTTVSGGGSIQATLTFSGLTPTNGALVRMTVSMTAGAPSAVPISDVLVPAARKTWQVSIPTNPVDSPQRVIVTASWGGASKSVVVIVR